ncbi:hypothetical protein ACFSHT_10495 [Paraburkholderia silviterrae]|uniref:Uncharacterized protein n=1 Tax=Paraburkholderia silviterrae TaxID=2528715 RepID=A0A4R5ME93_9BURK|nr:hypothetical protein [Paraburkholderia silviterrae]TDG25379.1 hypothetical protein EYW47_05975 [Paraburkholderia silviterrae]
MEKLILKVFALFQGSAFGGLAGSVVSVASIPFKPQYLPLTLLVATTIGAAVGAAAAAVRLRHAH